LVYLLFWLKFDLRSIVRLSWCCWRVVSEIKRVLVIIEVNSTEQGTIGIVPNQNNSFKNTLIFKVQKYFKQLPAKQEQEEFKYKSKESFGEMFWVEYQ
jgi:hypothetical protein